MGDPQNPQTIDLSAGLVPNSQQVDLSAGLMPKDETSSVKAKYGLPDSVDLSKPYLQQASSGQGIDPVNFSKAYAEANGIDTSTPQGFWSNLWAEGKNLFHGLTAAPQGSEAAPNVSDVTGAPAAVKSRLAQFATDPRGAFGAAAADTLAMAAPMLLDRFMGAGSAPAEMETAEEGAQPKITVPTTPTVPKTAIGKAAAAALPGNMAETLGLTDGPPVDLMTRAVKPMSSNTGWTKAVIKALPDMKAAEADLGHPVQGVDDALEASSIAKKKLWEQYSAKLQEAQGVGHDAMNTANSPAAMTSETPFAGHGSTTIDGNAVADAMMQSIDARTRTQHPEIVDRIEKVADTYRRPLQLDEAEDFLQSANNELHNYYAKNKVGQQVAKNDPTQGFVVAEADALRDGLYSKIDELTGPGARDLKQRYGALSNVQNELMRRQNVVARQQPESLAEQISMARGYGKIVVGTARMDPFTVMEGAQSIGAAKYLKARATADAMITRAFSRLGAPQPSVPIQSIYRQSAAPVAAGAVAGAMAQSQQDQGGEQ